MTVKTYQHRKGIGNARSTARAMMLPILRDISGLDTYGQAETTFGPERVSAVGTLSVNLSTGAGIVAMGRLERLSAEDAGGDVRLMEREAYRLYWLPYEWTHASGDYHGNPQQIGTEINAGTAQLLSRIVARMRVWIPLDIAGVTNLDDALAHEFEVVTAFAQGIGDVVEYEATIVRVEGAPTRTVNLT